MIIVNYLCSLVGYPFLNLFYGDFDIIFFFCMKQTRIKNIITQNEKI